MTDADPPTVERGAQFDATALRARPALLAALVDYRGDITVSCDDDDLAGYLYEVTPDPVRLRMLPDDGGAPRTVRLDAVRSIAVTGRDTAEGKSFETWVRKYAERKLGVAAPGKEGQDR